MKRKTNDTAPAAAQQIIDLYEALEAGEPTATGGVWSKGKPRTLIAVNVPIALILELKRKLQDGD